MLTAIKEKQKNVLLFIGDFLSFCSKKLERLRDFSILKNPNMYNKNWHLFLP